jgi:ketosteroid isomerase-like protein
MGLWRWVMLVLVLVMGLGSGVKAQTAAADIKAVMEKQVVDWNRGDVDAFAKGYKDAPDILFMGNPISRGYQGMIANYKKNYGSREKMGTLSFSELAVQPLDAKFATVTGKFHLERTAAGGGNAEGYYLLVCEKTAAGWKIIRDASTQVAKK